MSYAVITTKVDPATKKAAQQTADELGIPLSIIIKGYVKQFIRTKTVTFSAQEEQPSQWLKDAIKQARQNRRAGKASPVFQTGNEAVAWLEKQGV